MKAIGRAAIPAALPRRDAVRLDTPSAEGRWERPSQRDPWILRGLLWRVSCRLLVPVNHPDGSRAYSCGTGCGHADVLARPMERDLLLKVLVRAAFVMKRPMLVAAEERRRWERVPRQVVGRISVA